MAEDKTEGYFDLKGPEDLLRKMLHDLDEFVKNPCSTYCAFNFFVTAEHMKDWILPGYANQKAREDLDRAEPRLQICSHIANGAKHFIVEAKKHKSVIDTSVSGMRFPEKNFPSSHFPSNKFPKGILSITLQKDFEKQFGKTLGALDFAHEIFKYWKSYLESKL